MSADSPRRGLHKGAQVISPQPISDRSIIDSVAGIINDIVPQAYTSVPSSDNRETITWARFEYGDVNDPSLFPDYIEGSSTPPLLLVLGYATGVQVWIISASGEATEVLSWRQGVVRTLRLLPDPLTDEDHLDPYEKKRPIVAICDSAGPGPQFCSVSFISLKTGEQTKSIKFKNPVCDVLANKRSVVVTFAERIAVFDARTFDDVLTVTTCYLSPGPNPNPVALGTRWLAYSEKKLLPARRSSGGSEGEGVQSYTAAVLYAAKSLGKGLRGLGETVASSLTGTTAAPIPINNAAADITQPGVITILDLQAAKEEKELDDPTIETVVAHFTAHSDAIVAMTFDETGAILMTADRRGHDFHVFRIQPHPGGPTLAAVHHLYVLHRGDTTAKVQDMVFSSDTRWAAVSTVRGTTHVFPVAPYGGPVGMRTHSTPHVVNRLSRFHRSAGLTDDGTRSHSPVSHTEMPISAYPYSNPRLPPYPHPTILHPLAQIRQPSTLNHSNNQTQPSRPQQRQRLHSDDNGTLPLKICACFAPPRAWIYSQRDSTSKVSKRAVDSLFIMACHGNMIQYDLEPKPAAGIPKEKVCDDTMIELEVEAKGQWPLLRIPNSLEIIPPLPSSSPLLCYSGCPKSARQMDTAEDRWLSQVEIVTHAGPHRRLWMGPQFVFKTYNAPSGVNLVESEAVEIGVTGGSRPARSNPVNMPHAAARPLVPVVIDGSGSSYEQSPRFMEAYGDSLENETMDMGNGENQLREDLAEAMLETSAAPNRVPGRRLVVERVGQPVTKVVNPLGTVITVMADEEDASSSQEFDDDRIAEAPRSVCAEEGPASLNDFDTDVNPLRNLTEICAEMRSASEPAIDSVPDDDIRDVKEHKQLCVEAATMTPDSCVIDYERGAFRDVPTSLSLCAEQGEIPRSPMTLARENSWIKRSPKREDDVHERSIAAAKYVVNYDDDSIVLMENKTAELDKYCDEPEPEKVTKRPGIIVPKRNKKSAEGPKYLLQEHEDSVIIEDTSGPRVEAKKLDVKLEKTDVKTDQRRAKKEVMERAGEAEAMIVERLDQTIDNFVELKALEALADEDQPPEPEPMDASVSSLCKMNLPLELPTLDDFNCMDYHIIEPNVFTKETYHVSDDDIEHISSEVVLELVDAKLERFEKLDSIQDYEVSPVRHRKSSKSTISDDDLEHIQASEITELLERAKSFAMERAEDLGKKGVLSDDDLELVPPLEGPASPALGLSPPPGDSKSPEPLDKPPPVRSRGSRKRKDVVVIDSDPSEAEVTVIVKSLGAPGPWRKSKSPDKDLTEEIDRCSEPKSDQNSSQSLPKKTRVRTPKTPAQIPKVPSVIEIIDIDAMQKAEMEIAGAPAPECKILEGCGEMSMRMKKSRRKKVQLAEGVAASKGDEAEGNWESVRKPRVEEQREVGRVEEEGKENREMNEGLVQADSKGSRRRGKKTVNSVTGVSSGSGAEHVEGCGAERGGGEKGAKQSDSEQENQPERSSSSDDLNANVVPMDTEEDSGVKDVNDKGNSTASPSWSTVSKKNCRSKKKKRR
ncbi:uncharacterized protein LOC107036778 [Diachasma alloeum]|uniref:uncharacterized protein LOC107036778 n=1 Tax=Diachasma alloeum TaxID=454923 RepID=UPI0007383057|nr:uncharacterized protein LOC107036778 [Diachasma alloeum]